METATHSAQIISFSEHKFCAALSRDLTYARLCAQLADANCELGKITPEARQAAYDHLSDVLRDADAQIVKWRRDHRGAA